MCSPTDNSGLRLNTSNSEIDSPIVATLDMQSLAALDKFSSCCAESEITVAKNRLPVRDTLRPCRLSCTCVDSNLHPLISADALQKESELQDTLKNAVHDSKLKSPTRKKEKHALPRDEGGGPGAGVEAPVAVPVPRSDEVQDEPMNAEETSRKQCRRCWS